MAAIWIIFIVYIEISPTTTWAKLIETFCIFPREHEGTERDTEGVGCDMS